MASNIFAIAGKAFRNINKWIRQTQVEVHWDYSVAIVCVSMRAAKVTMKVDASRP